jgi:hypothetical protein
MGINSRSPPIMLPKNGPDTFFTSAPFLFMVKKKQVLHSVYEKGAIMKKILILIILAGMLFAAGCTSMSPNPGSPAATPVPATFSVPADALPMNGHAVHTTPNTTFEVWVDSFELGAADEKGVRPLTIYVAAKNTGTGPLRLVWYSKLTDLNGNTYGGIGISHGGNGARSDWIKPNTTEAARDYINIYSDSALATLSKGAVLDVYFIEKPGDSASLPLIPDYHTFWIIDPGTIH